MGLIPVPWDAVSVCLSVQAVLKWKEYERLFLSAFEHADDIHLYYNMLSFLAKGRTLERHFGSPYFAYLLSVFTVLTSVTYVGLEVLLSEIFHDKGYYKICAVGFSGVIFALKVLTTHYWETGHRRYFGMRVSAKYAVWVELLAIQLMVPNASFVGHLAGILVGVMYTQGPLKFLMDLPVKLFESVEDQPRSRARYTNWGSGVSGSGSPTPSALPPPHGWRYGDAYGNYGSSSSNGGIDGVSDEDYDEAVRRSYETLQQEERFASVPPGDMPTDPDELRRRRLQFLQRSTK